MSASARAARNGAARRALQSSNLPIRSHFAVSPSHSVFSRQNSHHLPHHVRALAIILPQRNYATETSTAGSSAGSFPPPGFNAEEAKKPLPLDDSKKQTSAASSASAQTTRAKTEGVSTTTEKKRTTEDQSLTELAAEKAAFRKAEEKKLEESKKEGAPKLTIMQKVKRELHHYWDGTKLLAAEVKISFKLALKMAAGYELTRRENRQLQRTVQDLGRLVPFSVFVIVPFAELLLPVALKIFPNMLPSTYEGQKSKDAKATVLRTTRKEVSNLLRDTLKESGLPVSAVNAQREEFTEFFRKVRATGESPTSGDVIKVCKLFKDDLTLDNLSRPQLVGMTKYMNLNAFGTDMMLRYQIRHRMRQIKRDDRAISFEGVDSLSVPELQMACASRGLRTHGMSPSRLREDLQMWLDLRLKYGVPSTLLVLSNAFMYAQGKDSELDSQIDALQAVLSSIPEELFHEIELEVHNAEGAATNKQRLEVLKEQEELIEEENTQSQVNGAIQGSPKDTENIDEEQKVSPRLAREVEEEQKDEAATAEADAVKMEKHQQGDKEANA